MTPKMPEAKHPLLLGCRLGSPLSFEPPSMFYVVSSLSGSTLLRRMCDLAKQWPALSQALLLPSALAHVSNRKKHTRNHDDPLATTAAALADSPVELPSAVANSPVLRMNRYTRKVRSLSRSTVAHGQYTFKSLCSRMVVSISPSPVGFIRKMHPSFLRSRVIRISLLRYSSCCVVILICAYL